MLLISEISKHIVKQVIFLKMDTPSFHLCHLVCNVYLVCVNLQVEFSSTLPTSQNGTTITHFAVEQDDNTSLHIVDFLISNSQHVIQKDSEGNTPLHVAARYGKLNCMKLLLLKTTGEFNFQNAAGKTPKDVAKECNFEEIVDLLSENKHKRIEISMEFDDIDWGLPEVGGEGLYELPLGMTLSAEKSGTGEDQATPPAPFYTGSLEPGEGTPPVPPRRSKGQRTSESSNRDSMLDVPRDENYPPVPPRPDSHQAFLARALFDCEADYRDELSFAFGDNIVVTQILDEDWWRGFLISNRNAIGVFPSCYVERVEGNKIPSAT